MTHSAVIAQLDEARAKAHRTMEAQTAILKEGGEWTAEQEKAFDEAASDFDRAEERMQKIRDLEARDRKMAEEQAARDERLAKTAKDVGVSEEEVRSKLTAAKNLRTALDENGDPIDIREATENEMKRFRAVVNKRLRGRNVDEKEYRAAQVDPLESGGILVPALEVSSKMLKALDDDVVIRDLADVIPLVSAENLGIPTLDTDLDDLDWTTELGTGSLSSGPEHGMRELNPKPLAKRVKGSKKLLRLRPSYEQFLIDRLMYKMALTEDKAFLTGSGNNSPLGIFTANANGVPTSQDVAGSNTTTAIHPDTLWDMYFQLKSGHAAKSTWVLHRLILKAIRKLVLNSGDNYVWAPGVNGVPSTICDRPYRLSDNAPSTQTAGLYVAVLGNFEYYQIAESLRMELQVLNELYAETNQVGLIGRREVDGQPVLSEAFVRMKMADS